MRSAGMAHSAPSRSNSSQVAFGRAFLQAVSVRGMWGYLRASEFQTYPQKVPPIGQAVGERLRTAWDELCPFLLAFLKLFRISRDFPFLGFPRRKNWRSRSPLEYCLAPSIAVRSRL